MTPKHSSGLNQIEVIFGIIHRRAIRRASFSSIEELKERLLAFIEYFNNTFARPFRWTYTVLLQPHWQNQVDLTDF